MRWVMENAEKLGGLATVGTMIIALCALVFAIIQIWVARTSQREATAKDTYRDYLRLAFENPKYANPEKFIALGDGGWKEDGDWIQDERYRWFVAFMLNSCDEILWSQAGDKIWRHVILEDLRFHKSYLRSREFEIAEGGWGMFSPELKEIADAL
jgi:hypothetical protein